MAAKITAAAEVAAELQSLLAPLSGSGGGPLDLSVLASVHLPARPASQSNGPTNGDAAGKAAVEAAESSLLRLFESHVGPRDEVVNNAVRVASWAVRDEAFYAATNYGAEPVDRERFKHPRNRIIAGPRPDLWVWVEMFLGTEGAASLRRDCPYDPDEDDPALRLEQLEGIRRALDVDVRTLPTIELLTNVLSRLREYSEEVRDGQRRRSPRQLLRFAAVYGLSGAMDDILGGSYGAVGDLTINDALCVHEDPMPDGFELECGGELSFPPYAIGAVLGHCNVAEHALGSLGGEINPPYQLRRGGGRKVEVDTCASDVLSWALNTNQPDAVKCLVAKCGFQFRWLDKDTIGRLFECLLHIDRMGDEFGPWRGRTYDSERYMFDNRAQRKYRARVCYEEKENMLRTVIEVGMPLELFVPTVDYTLDREAVAKARADGKEEIDRRAAKEIAERIERSSTRAEKKARNKIWMACASFNAVQVRGEDGSDDDDDSEDEQSASTLYPHEFYDRLRSMWKDQPASQPAKMPEYEALDPRWVEERKRDTEGGGNEDESESDY